jgi:hypothetical protein
MSNASQCRVRAARYRALAAAARNPDRARAYGKLERLWLEIAPVADAVDRGSNAARDRLYAMIDRVEDVRHHRA